MITIMIMSKKTTLMADGRTKPEYPHLEKKNTAFEIVNFLE